MRRAEVHYPLHLSFLIQLLNDSTLHITSGFDSQLKRSKSIDQTHRTQSITKMRLAGKAVTSKDKCYRMHRNQRFSLKLFSLASILMVIRSGNKNLLHQSEQFLEDGLREKEKNKETSASFLFPKIFRAKITS